MSNVIDFKPRKKVTAPPQTPPKLTRSFGYELLFVRNLLIWLVVGAVLGLFLPAWAIFVGLILVCYWDGKRKFKGEQQL